VTTDELDRLAGIVTAMWPGQGWPKSTVAVAGALFADVEYTDAEKALAGLIRGREYPPPPGVLLERAEQVAAARSMRPDPERLRLPTPEERAVAARTLPELRAAVAALARKRAMSPEAR